jgi:adenylate cyclase
MTGADGKLWLRFGAPGTFRYIPAWQVLEAWQDMADGEDQASAIKFLGGLEGAVVIVSATATGAHDLRPNPVAAVSPGCEIHATAVANLLDGRWVSPPPVWSQVAGAVGLALLVGVLSLRIRRPALLGASGLALVSAWCAAAGIAWTRADLWLPVCLPVLGGVLAIPTLLVEGWWREGAERRRVQGIFGRYVAPDILRVLLHHPEAARLGGERRRITVLFSDIRSYTTLSEKLPPEEVVGWLNEYFTEQVAVIHAHRGTVDKFIGDAVMAFWGAPVATEDGPGMACRAALECQERLVELNARWAREGRPELKTGIGINTARVVVGNFGSTDRLNYSLLGDGVNLAARLEKLNREYRTLILLSESTLERTAGQFETRLVDSVLMRGRTQQVRIYELVRQRAAVGGTPDR